jgi:hypothetical protein
MTRHVSSGRSSRCATVGVDMTPKSASMLCPKARVMDSCAQHAEVSPVQMSHTSLLECLEQLASRTATHLIALESTRSH